MKTRTMQAGLIIFLSLASIGCQTHSVQMTSVFTNALLLDVRNGYPYGTASATLSATKFSASQTYRDKSRNLADKNQVSTVIKLIPKVQKMMKKLMEESKQA